MKILTAATRASKLALAQTHAVISALHAVNPDVKVRIKRVTTSGDRDRNSALWKLSDSGFFTSQIEKTLLEGQADFAVHSFKDLPTKSAAGLVIAAIPHRGPVEDVIVSNVPIGSIEELPPAARIGTASPRRMAILKHLRRDLDIVPLRGNIHTRLGRLDQGGFDCIVLARAGLERLGLGERISLVLDPMIFVPAAAQGAVAVQAGAGDTQTSSIVAAIDDPSSRQAALAERLVLEALHPGCHAPVGVYARIDGSDMIITAFVGDMDGRRVIYRQVQGSLRQGGQGGQGGTEPGKLLAQRLVRELIEAGAVDILKRTQPNE